MSSVSSRGSLDRIIDVLGFFHDKGVNLWVDKGELHYKAPKGVLTQEEREMLRMSREQLIALLDTRVQAQEPEVESSLRPCRVPLTSSQLAHWHLYQLHMRPAIRQIASATRLRGRLKLDALGASITEVVRRHDALRTRIVMCDGVPSQEIAESVDCELQLDDLTALSERSREIEVHRQIDKLILEPIDITAGPLFGICLLKLRDDEHVLIVAMEHIISDAVSRSILLRELFTAYAQAVRGRPFSLPAVSVQFGEYAFWQSNARSSWIEKRGARWNESPATCQLLKFPEDRTTPAPSPLGWGTVPIKITKDVRAEVGEWSRRRGTTHVICAFTAYVSLVLRWCEAGEAVFKYQIDGRASPKLENTIGCFTLPLYLRLGLLKNDTFVDLVNRLTSEYCTAYECAESFRMTTQVSHPTFTGSTFFNWIVQGFNLKLGDLDESEDMLICSPIPFMHPMLRNMQVDGEPGLLLYDACDKVDGSVLFPLNRFSTDTMERFGRNFLVFLMALLRKPEGRIADVRIV